MSDERAFFATFAVCFAIFAVKDLDRKGRQGFAKVAKEIRNTAAILLMLVIDKAALQLYCLDGMPHLILRHGFGGNQPL
jgi:hypothetical protein